jgi:hypothetical protein
MANIFPTFLAVVAVCRPILKQYGVTGTPLGFVQIYAGASTSAENMPAGIGPLVLV